MLLHFHGMFFDVLLPLARAALVYRVAVYVHGYRNRHVFNDKLMDGFHAEIFKGQYARLADRFGNQIGSATHGHQVHRTVLLDGSNTAGAALGLADHAEETAA